METNKKPMKMYKCVFDGNKQYELTEEEMEKSIGLIVGKTTQAEFDEILKNKTYEILPPRKTPYN